MADYLLLAELNLGFEQIVRRSDGMVELKMTGFPGDTYTLQSSTNLVDWEFVTTVAPFADGTFSFLDTTAPAQPYRFYRLTWP